MRFVRGFFCAGGGGGGPQSSGGAFGGGGGAASFGTFPCYSPSPSHLLSPPLAMGKHGDAAWQTFHRLFLWQNVTRSYKTSSRELEIVRGVNYESGNASSMLRGNSNSGETPATQR